ncbi:Nuclear protein 1 [Mizuhopecten yessoensis]|uniref:Nuclear protein 1 n=1 Tax=Mizuhopecten yessoensis TaxID=6573 RepID=A0A210PYW4_MIZYE|nr:Nuclear protein 1 [Mizuhopecten yessoensis]
MSDYFVANYLDDIDMYSVEQHKYIHNGHSGKGRSKREASLHTNVHDPTGHTRKAVQKLINNKLKQRSKN